MLNFALVLASLTGLVPVSFIAAHTKPRPRWVVHPPFTVAKSPIFIRCKTPRVIDGDTIHCASGYRLRLLGVQAPELKCKPGQDCVAGDAVAAQRELQKGLALSAHPTFQYILRDNRSRPVVIVRSGKVNLNCRQLERSDSVLKFDYRKLIERECPPPSSSQ